MAARRLVHRRDENVGAPVGIQESAPLSSRGAHPANRKLTFAQRPALWDAGSAPSALGRHERAGSRIHRPCSCREPLAGSIRSKRLIEVLTRLVSQHGAPLFLRSDNGPEFVSLAVLEWLAHAGIGTA